MKKRMLAAITACCLLGSMTVPAMAVFDGFERVNTYTPGQFTDVPADLWCADNVRTAYEYGIMNGVQEDYFDTDSNLSIAQTIAMACRLHSGYEADEAEFAADTPWYQPYLDYAAQNGIPYVTDNYDAAATRAVFAGVIGSALPDEALPAINSIADDAIPDVQAGMTYSEDIYRLYRAGVLTGNDVYGTFAPDSFITRGAAAALVSRMADPALRQTFTLAEKPFTPVPIGRLQNRTSLKGSCTDAEFQAAYDVAVEFVRPLANLSREYQLIGIASGLRRMFDSGMQYSSSAPHYNDPYGYFVLGVASCAGCTRATGLCLNILGIPYEHVNENQWSHQWCRVNVNGTYWICDAYGLYCGEEPAPYQHPYL